MHLACNSAGRRCAVLLTNAHFMINMKKFTQFIVLLALGVTRVAVANEPPPTNVMLIDHTKVEDAFAKGQPLLTNEHYKILAARRTAPGIVEVHEHDTDVFYVLEGSATLMTGGSLVESKTENPGEIRAKETTGGVANPLTKGDVIVIPKGIPHWFTAVSGTFLYFVVKVTE
jgi:quercetin dioxygenase-like cupin family protein